MRRILLQTIFLSLLAFETLALSAKGRKLLEENEEENLVEEEDDDDFFSFGDDDDGGSLFDDDDGGSLFDDEDDGLDITGQVQVQTCDNSTFIPENATCVNGTLIYPEPEPEVRYRDPLLERLVTQIWSDFQTKVNQDAALEVKDRGSIIIDPLDIDALLKKPINISQRSSMYSVDVAMDGMKMFGLSQVRLDSAEVSRSENLTDLRVDFRLAFDYLLINGTYSMKGEFGWWEVDSRGMQSFGISMENATFSYRMTLELVEPDWEAAFDCFDDLDVTRPAVGNVFITKIGMPIDYDDVDFRFDNLGGFANTVANGVGIYFLQSQEDMLIKKVKEAIKTNVNSLIC